MKSSEPGAPAPVPDKPNKERGASLWPASMRALAAMAGPSADRHPRVVFQGKEYFLIGTLEQGGALATREQYENGECSFAHLCPDGRILRFNEHIGTRADLSSPPDVAPAEGLGVESSAALREGE